MRRRNIGTILLAALLIAVGAVLIGIYFFDWQPYWFAGWWTLLIMAAAVVSMVSHGARFWNCMMLGTAVLLFARLQEFFLLTWRQWWAAEVSMALIALGILLIIHMVRPRRELPPPPAAGVPYDAPPQGAYAAGPAPAGSTPASGESYPTRFALFSSEACRSDCRQLKGGRFSAIFGSVTANLVQADFTEPVTVEANTLFGGVDIITPPGVRVECSGTSIFGGCDAKAITGRPYDPAHPVLTIRYFSVFSGVNVK
ncbi:MAG: cell wall-active antibiotics response protein [Firmicutes bacterium]|nr:cell wall-active antibiotics response protein [Bacillota bacterium]